MKLQPGQRNDPSLRTESTVAAALFGLSLLPAAPVAADIDEQIAQRVAAIEETLERLEFDAGRIDEPPAYQQALKAFSGSICAALTASTDIDANLFSLSAAFEGEAEAEVLMPGADAVVATAFNEFEAEGGPSMSLSGLLDFSGGATHRLCINPVPWAVYLYYLAQSSIPGQPVFPQVVPGEVFTGGQAQTVSYGAGTALQGLSTDAQAFLLALASQIFEGLGDVDAGAASSLPWFEDRVDDLMGLAQGAAVGLSDVAAAASGIGAVVGGLGDAVTSLSVGGFFETILDIPEQIAAIVPFAPQVTWITDNPFGVESIDELNYCDAIDSSDMSTRVPFIYATLDEACDVTEESLAMTRELVENGFDIIWDLYTMINEVGYKYIPSNDFLEWTEPLARDLLQALETVGEGVTYVRDRVAALLEII